MRSSSGHELAKPRRRLTHSDSESNIGSTHATPPGLTPSVSGSAIDSLHQGDSLVTGSRYYSDSNLNLKLPPIISTGPRGDMAHHQHTRSDSLDNQSSSSYWTNTTDHGPAGGPIWPEGYPIFRRSSWSESGGRHSRTSSVSSTHSHSDDLFNSSSSQTSESFHEGGLRRRAESHGNILQPLYEKPEAASSPITDHMATPPHSDHTHMIASSHSDHILAPTLPHSNHTHVVTPPLDHQNHSSILCPLELKRRACQVTL